MLEPCASSLPASLGWEGAACAEAALSPYVCGPGSLETRPSSDRPGALRDGFVAEVSLHIVGSPPAPLSSFFLFFFFIFFFFFFLSFLFFFFFFFPSMRLQKVFGLSRFCGKRSLVKRRG